MATNLRIGITVKYIERGIEKQGKIVAVGENSCLIKVSKKFCTKVPFENIHD